MNDINEFVGGGIDIDGQRINVLLYADDIVLVADDSKTLQAMINKLFEYCVLWDLEVNKAKSEIVIMKKGGGV